MAKKDDALMQKMIDMVEDGANPDLPVQESGESSRAIISTIRKTGMHEEGFTLPLTEIETNPNQVRKDFDDEKILQLAESIRVNGLLQPLAVEKCLNGKNLCIDGERRYLALKIIEKSNDFGKINPEKIPVFTALDTGEEEDLRLLLGLIANEMRVGNSEADKSRLISRLVAAGTPRELILQRTLMSKGTLSKYVKTGIFLTEEALTLAGKSGMALTSLYEIINLAEKAGHEKQNKEIEFFIKENIEKKPTVKEWGELAKKRFAENPIKPKNKNHSNTIIKAGRFTIKWKEKRSGLHIEIDGLNKSVLKKITKLIEDES